MADENVPVMNTPQKIKYSDLISQAVDGVATERRFVPTKSGTNHGTYVG